ncbi:MAG: Trp family transcriptional regulator [Patescibacteria group bacterium]|nr:Trp family transcriptional regulator [Patescibacteria group bacterium]
MPHISANQVKKKVFLQISDQLIRSVTKTAGENSSRRLIGELFTPTERIMLAKRLAAVVMIQRGYSCYRITKTLKISSSTTSRFYRQVKLGKFDYLAKLLTGSSAKNKRERARIDITLEQLLRGGLSPRVGKSRWQYLNKQSKF